jgi:hypothetical protein
LKVYKSSGAYTNGKADPFADPVTGSDGTGEDASNGSASTSGSTGTSGTTSNTSSGTQTSDGTLFNSTSKK